MRTSGTYAFPPMDRVIYGRPHAEALAEEVARLGKERVFLMVSRTLNTKTNEIARVRDALGPRFVGQYDRVPQHTSRTEVVEAGLAARGARADLIVAIGGGSVVDAAKMVLVCMEHRVTDIDQIDPFVIKPGPGGRLIRPEYRGPSVRMIAVPSTLSGGEYNAGTLVTDPRHKLKETFFHELMMPVAIILDPALTVHAPEQLWLGSGTRAMDHGIEGLLSPRGTPLTDAAVLRGIRLLAEGLRRSKHAPDDMGARAQCQFGSWLASFGLQARVGMGASHAIGHVLGGTCDVPHYLCTPVMMPSVLRYNKPVTEEAQALLAEALGRPGMEAADAFAELVADLGLPGRLRDVGVTAEQFALIGRNTMTEFFIFLNPRKVKGPEDVVEILKMAA